MDDAPPPPVPASFSLKKPLKIAKVVRPPPTAAEAVDVAPVLSDTEEERRFVLKYQALRSGIYKLEATSSLAPLLDVAPLGETLFAFDFDQTLHVRERVRGRALEFLLRVSAAGAPVCIVTAAAPNASSVRAVAAELAELGLDSFFQTTKLDRARALDLVRARWPENEALGKDELQEKMIVLLALLTDRRAADLARIGHSGIKIEQSGAAATYRLQRGPTDWSADLVLQGVPNDVSVCPVACLKAFLERISATRPVPQYKIIDPEVDMPEPIAEMDRLFLSDDNSHVLPRELELLVERVLRQCEYPDFQIAGLLREPCLEVNVSGIQMARYGSLIAAKYNKAEAVEYYLAEHSRCNHVVFVDDNFDNVFGVFLKFAQLEEKHRAAVVGAEKTPRAVTMHSVWYEPPADGKPEVWDGRRMTLGSSIMRMLPRGGEEGRSAQCDFGVMGVTRLAQADALAPVMVEGCGEGTLTVAASQDGSELFHPFGKNQHGPPEVLRQGRPSFFFSLFDEGSLVGRWAVLRSGATTAVARIMKG